MLQRHRIKPQSLLFALMLFLGAGQGTFAAEHEKKTYTSPEQQSKPAPKDGEHQKQPVTAPPTFTPTEEVSAGKVVSFPTDI